MILAPFKWIVALFFNWSDALFHDPGWAVVGMSVLLSLLLTPLYIWIERRKNSDRAKSAPMQAEIDKIEAVYSGRERFYYTREIHRRYKYSPWTAMIPTLGLLVQIPFLLAAYHYLSDLPVFNGAAFWHIKDLSKPDTIATFAGFPINLLAILMTVINLVSGWRYAESGKPKERIQYMAVAAVFLVLLYNCAASVVLYWTLSNALSLVRSEVFFRKKGGVAGSNMTCWGFVRICHFLSPYAFVLLFMMSMYCFASGWIFVHVGGVFTHMVFSMEKCGVLSLLAAWLLLVVLDSASNAVCAITRIVRTLQRSTVVFMLTVLCLSAFTDCPLQDSPVFEYFLNRAWGVLGVAVATGFVVDCSAVAALLGSFRIPCENKGAGGAFCGFSIVGYLLGTLFVWHPLLVYASDPMSFAASGWNIFISGVFWLVCGLACFGALWVVAGRHMARLVIDMAALVVASTAFISLFILHVDVGTLQGAELVNASGMVRRVPEYALEGVCLLLVVVLSVVAILRVPGRCIAVLFSILHLIVCGQAIVKLVGSNVVAPSVAHDSAAKDAAGRIMVSKGGRNVMVFMLDMVQGNSFNEVYADKSLSAGLDGFTWYPNCVSIANMTHPSMPAIYGGEGASPERLNEDPDRTLNEKATDVIRGLADFSRRMGMNFTHYNYLGVFKNELMQPSPLHDRAYLSALMGRRDYHGNAGRLALLKVNALFQAAPLLLKPLVYNGGKWRFGLERSRVFATDHMFYEALPLLSEARDDDGGYFNFFHVEVTHNPWGVPTSDGVMRGASNVEVLKWIVSQLEKYFDWMKANGVYDNTRIVLVSDHGLENMTKEEYDAGKDPIKNKSRWKELIAGVRMHSMLDEHRIQMMNCLLAVKDYNVHGSLRREDKITSNADVRRILRCDSVKDEIAAMPEERDAFVVVSPRDGFPNSRLLDILVHFRIHGNMFDLANWERVK